MWKRVLAIALAVIYVFALVGCAPEQSNDAPAASEPSTGSATNEVTPNEAEATEEVVTIDFWFEGSGPERTEAFQSIIDEFNATHDNIQVEGTYLALDTALDKLTVAISGGETPDVCTLQGSWLADMFSQEGLLVDLTDRFAAWEESSQFTTDFLDVVKYYAPDGKLYAIPQAANVFGLWYRPDLWAEKGLTDPAESWDALFSGITSMTDKENNVYGHTVRGGATSCTQLMYVLIAYTGCDSFFDENGQAQVLRSPAAVEIVNRYIDVYKNGEAPQSSLTASFKEMAADFTSGTSVSYIHNLGSYETLKSAFDSSQYAFIMLPKSPVTGMYTTATPTVKANAMFTSCEHPDEAWEFMKFWASKEADGTINSVVGELPVRQDTLEEEWAKNAPQLKSVIPFLADPNKTTVMTPDFVPGYSDIAAQIGEPNFQAVMTGDMTAEEYLESIAVPLEEAYANYLAN